MAWFVFLSELPEGRVFALDGQTFLQVFAQILNVSLLAFVLAKLLYQPVRKFLAARSERIQNDIEQAAEDRKQAHELRQHYETKIIEAERERDEIIDKARKDASETSRRILADTKREADALKARAAADVQNEWQQAQAELKRVIVEVSAAMTAKFIAASIDEATQDRLFDEAMAELRGARWQS